MKMDFGELRLRRALSSRRAVWRGVWVALCATAVGATAEDDDPIAFLKSHDAEVQAILAEAPTDSLPPAVREEIKKHINAAFDFRELSRLALGITGKNAPRPSATTSPRPSVASFASRISTASPATTARARSATSRPRCKRRTPPSKHWHPCGTSK